MFGIQLFSPLAVANNRCAADYYIYIKEYKNGKREISAYDGMAKKPFIYLRSTSLTPKAFLKKHFSHCTEKEGWKVHTY